MSLTAHYIDKEWNLVARCLKTQYHPEAHTAENLATFFQDGLSEYGLKTGYVVSMTTDSAANMVAAVRESGELLLSLVMMLRIKIRLICSCDMLYIERTTPLSGTLLWLEKLLFLNFNSI